LEIQVEDEHDFPERSVYYWTRVFSSALPERGQYSTLPQTIVISILAFTLFRCAEYYSEFRLLEIKRHEQLTDKMCMVYFELPKVPEIASADGELMYWLLLFKAKTEEELTKIEKEGGSIMAQAIAAYRHISASEEFKERERMRVLTMHNEASALGNAERKGIIKVAKSMKDEGMEIDTILRITKLTVDDILRL
jgi:predicted transposase/invertase (TIGR01784 family)